ncbi:MAG: DUF4258 domain-containing protein [Anaerolineae bacterium]|nr:DUF4258 domain-containing protein [Anaerolineae bacterium]
MTEEILIRIRRAVREGRYDFTDHLLEEAAADGLTTDDVLHVLLAGALDSTYGDDPRGPRYVVRGDVDVAEVDVVCRFDRDGRVVIIIMAYVVD